MGTSNRKPNWMRVFKFRAKPSFEKEVWVVGLISKLDTNICHINTGENEVEVDPATVGQFCGICDTSTPPQEIYEGDILELESGIRHLVKYDNDSAAYLGYKLPINKGDSGHHIETDWVDLFGTKIIGNVFDNPELIK